MTSQFAPEHVSPIPPRTVSPVLHGILGVATIVLGIVLLASPFTTLAVLALWIAAGAVANGVLVAIRVWTAGEHGPSLPGKLLGTVVAAVWVALGVVMLASPGTTIAAIALVTGWFLVASGILELAGSVMHPGFRLLLIGSGLLSVALGIMALAWPGVTLLVVAFSIGIRTIAYGTLEVLTAFGVGQRSQATSLAAS